MNQFSSNFLGNKFSGFAHDAPSLLSLSPALYLYLSVFLLLTLAENGKPPRADGRYPYTSLWVKGLHLGSLLTSMSHWITPEALRLEPDFEAATIFTSFGTFGPRMDIRTIIA